MDTKQLTFTAQYVNPPEGKKPGSIKTSTGNYITCWPAQMHHFQQGGEYRVDCYNKPYAGQDGVTKDQWTVSSHDTALIERIGAPPASSAPAATTQSATFVSDAEKGKSIVLQTIIKAVVGAGQTPGDADVWWAWYQDQMNGQPLPQSDPRPEPPLATEPHTQAQVDGVNDLDDSIAF